MIEEYWESNGFHYDIDDGITYQNEDGIYFCSKYARIAVVYINCSDFRQSYGIEYINNVTGILEKQRISYNKILPNAILSLLEIGLDVTNKNRLDLSNALLASLSTAKTIYVTDRYGFDQFKNQTIFVSNKIHSAKPIDDRIQISHSTYNLQPAGQKSNWLDMYVSCVKGHPNLELAVILGLSSPVLTILKQKHPDLRSLLVHLSGNSTTGKTTALNLAISTASSPNLGEKSLMRSWNSTQNAILGSLGGLHGLPIAFDELSTNTTTNLTSIVYSLTEGIGRGRANIDGSIHESATWSTVMLSSGELSIYNRLSNNTGLKIRVLDFEDLQWTDSAEQANQIKETITTNHGHILPDFVDFLLSYGLEKIYDCYSSQVDKFRQMLSASKTAIRFASKLAILSTTAELVNESNLLQVNINDLVQILVDYEINHIEERDLATLALDHLMQHLLANRNTLINNNTVGRRLGFLENETVFLYRSETERILKQLGFEDANLVIKNWSKNGTLITPESDRATTRRTKQGQRQIGYTIKIPTDYIDAGLRE